jgi:GntR family transcriptional regulator/MocR family aminotransferase
MLDDSGRVIYVGSFAKTTLATLRLGFVVTPPSLASALTGAKFLSDWHSPVPLQAALAEFIAAGHFARHVRRMRLVYEARHDLIGDILRQRFADHLEVIPSAAGLHICATAPALSVEQVATVIERAARAGVACHPLALFALDEPESAGFVIGYGAIATDRIEEGLERLHRCLVDVAERRRQRGPGTRDMPPGARRPTCLRSGCELGWRLGLPPTWWSRRARASICRARQTPGVQAT